MKMPRSQKDDFEKVLDILEYKILSGLLNPRERLIERELAEEYKISTGTVRKVLKELTVKNLIIHMPHRGAFVAEPTRKEAEDIFHTRILLESYALESVARNMTKTRLKKIETYETAFEKKLQTRNLRGILKYNRLFHQSIFETCGNVIVSEMIDQLRNRSRIWYHYIRGDARHREKSIQEHRDMIACLRSGNADKLKAVNETHLNSGYKSYTGHLPLMA